MHSKRKRLGKPFWRLWAAVASSSLGDGMFAVGIPLLALTITRSPLAISGLVIAGELPSLLVALPAGVLADRFDQRRLIIGIQLLRLALLATLAVVVVSDRYSVLSLFIAAFLLGGLNISFDIVAGSYLPFVVDRNSLVKANAHVLNAEVTSENLIGQALGGAAFSAARAFPFVVDAVSVGIAAVLLKSTHSATPPEPSETTAFEDLKAGLRWFAGHALLRRLTMVIAGLAFCQGVLLGLLPLYARETLGLSSTGYGLLLAVASIGSIFGSLIAGAVHQRFGSGGTLLVAAAGFGLAYPVYALTRSAVVVAGALLLQETLVLLGTTAARSQQQKVVPDEFQGRAMSASRMVVLSGVPVGSLLGGLVANSAGISTSFWVAGAAQAVFLATSMPGLLRRLGEIEPAHQ